MSKDFNFFVFLNLLASLLNAWIVFCLGSNFLFEFIWWAVLSVRCKVDEIVNVTNSSVGLTMRCGLKVDFMWRFLFRAMQFHWFWSYYFTLECYEGSGTLAVLATRSRRSRYEIRDVWQSKFAHMVLRDVLTLKRLYTAMFIWNRCLACLWREMRSLWEGKINPKNPASLLKFLHNFKGI